MNLITVEISDEVAVEVQPDVEHEWLISTADVAEGYGLSASGVQKSKDRYSDELEEGKHWVLGQSVSERGGRPKTMWTKKGVIRLGFLIKTPLAKQFRDWAEDFIIAKSEEKAKAPALPDFSDPVAMARAWADEMEQKVLANKKVEEMTPKVEAYDDLIHQEEDTYNDMTLSEVAKELGYKPRAEFFPMLRMAGIVFQSSSEPKVEYTQKGWFRGTPVNEGKYAGMSWKVTPKGMAEMLKKFGRKGDR